MSKIRTYLLISFGAASFLLGGCSGASKTEAETAEESAVVEYSCISHPESENKIYVILKNYHGAYWEKVINGITEAAAEMDEGVYLSGIDNETDISGQIGLMDEAVKQAKANSRRGLLVCGSEAIPLQAAKLLETI